MLNLFDNLSKIICKKKLKVKMVHFDISIYQFKTLILNIYKIK